MVHANNNDGSNANVQEADPLGAEDKYGSWMQVKYTRRPPKRQPQKASNGQQVRDLTRKKPTANEGAQQEKQASGSRFAHLEVEESEKPDESVMEFKAKDMRGNTEIEQAKNAQRKKPPKKNTGIKPIEKEVVTAGPFVHKNPVNSARGWLPPKAAFNPGNTQVTLFKSPNSTLMLESRMNDVKNKHNSRREDQEMKVRRSLTGALDCPLGKRRVEPENNLAIIPSPSSVQSSSATGVFHAKPPDAKAEGKLRLEAPGAKLTGSTDDSMVVEASSEANMQH